MPVPAWTDLLADATQRFAQALADVDLAAPVAACPGWSVRDVAVHLGGVHQWAAHAVRAGEPTLVPTQPDEGRTALVRWYADSARGLRDVLDATAPSAPAWTLDVDDRTAGFWSRRQVHETLMHLWDVEAAVGTPTPYAPDLAWDGVREVVEVMYPRQVRLGRVAPLDPGVRLLPTDVGSDVGSDVGPARTGLVLGRSGDLEVGAPAEVLLRLLWHRADPVAEVRDADPRALAALAGAVTP